MTVSTAIVKSPGWWLHRLTRRLVLEQRPHVERLSKLMDGDHPLQDILETEDERRAFRKLQTSARSNYLSLIVEAVVDRMRVIGFRTDADSREKDQETEKLWNLAHLDADQNLVHRSMLALSICYVMVGTHPRKRGLPLVTIEDPRYVITESFQDDRREVEAGLKLWVDRNGYGRAELFLPNEVYSYRSPTTLPTDATFTPAIFAESQLQTWELLTVARTGLGVVPIVPFRNREKLDGTTVGEFEDVVNIQNRINIELLIQLIAEKYGALRQRAILNLALGEDDDGEIVAPELPNSPGVAWLLDGENLRIWESAQTSTADIMAGITAAIRDLAAISRTPPHYLLNSIVNSSGDSLKAAETGHVAKVKERIAQAGESWEMVARLMHLIGGDKTLADPENVLEVWWADPESRSLAEISDAAVKQKSVDVPWRTVMELLGFTPAEIDRMEEQRTTDALLSAVAAPPPAQVVAAPPVAPGASAAPAPAAPAADPAVPVAA